MTTLERIAELETLLAVRDAEMAAQAEAMRLLQADLERARAELQIANAAAAAQHLVATERTTAIEEALAAPDGAPTNAILEAALASAL